MNTTTHQTKGIKLNWLAFLFIFSTSFVFAQQETAAPKAADNQGEKISEDVLREKLANIENSGASPEEIANMRASLYKDAGIAMPIYSQDIDFSFKPKYIPMAQLEAWKKIVMVSKPNALKNIVPINSAIFLDYNNYNDRVLDKKLNDMIYQNPLDAQSALFNALPDLNAMSAMLPEGSSMVNNLKIYFAGQPELLVLLPFEILSKTKTDNGIKDLMKMQLTTKKNNFN